MLHLLGCDLANPAIAEGLFISPKIVEHHISRFLAELGLRSRGEAAAYAAGVATSPDTPGPRGHDHP